MKLLLQICVQEKGHKDWRAFCICKDERGDRWELRGYGTTPGSAANDVYRRFRRSSEDWELFGSIIVLVKD